MQQATVSNPNDYKVVSFHNLTDFGFTPVMGCMYDGRPINGVNGSPGIDAGEKIVLPYHIANQIALNLAKYVMLKNSGDKQVMDAQGNPMIKAIWDSVKLEEMRKSYLTDLYSEEKPAAQSETDKLMAKVEALNKMVEEISAKTSKTSVQEPIVEKSNETPTGYQDKAEVISELNKRGIKFDARQSKANLEKLLA